MRETLGGSNALGKAKLDALRFHELKQGFAVSADVAIDFGQRGKVFAFGLTDVENIQGSESLHFGLAVALAVCVSVASLLCASCRSLARGRG
jgi:hypothetical protein